MGAAAQARPGAVAARDSAKRNLRAPVFEPAGRPASGWCGPAPPGLLLPAVLASAAEPAEEHPAQLPTDKAHGRATDSQRQTIPLGCQKCHQPQTAVIVTRGPAPGPGRWPRRPIRPARTASGYPGYPAPGQVCDWSAGVTDPSVTALCRAQLG